MIFKRDLVLCYCFVVKSRSRHKIKTTNDIQEGSYPSLLSGRKFKVMIHHFQILFVSCGRF